MKQLASQRHVCRTHISLIIILVTLATSGSTFSTSGAISEQQTTGQESKQTEVRELKVSLPIEREIVGGDAHSYHVMLTMGQYLRVVVEQKGMDVVVTLFGPGGQKITEVDSPNGT